MTLTAPEVAAMNAANAQLKAARAQEKAAKAEEETARQIAAMTTTITGPQGIQGPVGPEGPQGLAIKGEPGTNGTNGKDGDPGKTGPRGLQGSAGKDGVGPDEKVKLSKKDPVAGFLTDKLKAGLNVQFRREKSPDGDSLVIDATGGGGGGGGASTPQGINVYDDGVAVGFGAKLSFDGGDPVTVDGGGIIHVPVGTAGPSSDDQIAAEVPFTPAGTISATNVQAAIEEVAAEAGSGDVASVNGQTGVVTTPLANVLTAGNDTGGLGIVNVAAVDADADTSLFAAASGTGNANASAAATTVDGQANAARSASADGDGDADATTAAIVLGAGTALSGFTSIGGANTIGLVATATALGKQLMATGIPTADPAVAGAVWSNFGVLMVSAG